MSSTQLSALRVRPLFTFPACKAALRSNAGWLDLALLVVVAAAASSSNSLGSFVLVSLIAAIVSYFLLYRPLMDVRFRE